VNWTPAQIENLIAAVDNAAEDIVAAILTQTYLESGLHSRLTIIEGYQYFRQAQMNRGQERTIESEKSTEREEVEDGRFGLAL
jgi:hypothetical protein